MLRCAEPARLEPLTGEMSLYVTQTHHFGTDSVLLADFSMPRRGETCLELGAGCGAVSLLWLARALPQKVYALELQEDACQLLRRTAEHNGLEDRLDVLCEDLRQVRAETRLRGLDLVACNPPYYELGRGLLSGGDGADAARHELCCTLADVAAAAAAALRVGGRLCLCQRPARLPDALAALRAHGIEPKRLRLVQQRAEKAPFLFLLEGRKGGNPSLAVEPVLLLTEAGTPTAECRRIYGPYHENAR